MDPQKLLNQLLGNPGASAAAGGLAGGALAGLLTSKKGRKKAKKLATYGGFAAVGVMAYKAWQNSKQPATPPPPNPGATVPPPPPPAASVTQAATQAAFLPAPGDAAGADLLSRHLLEAMVSAAKSDGTIDAEERQRIETQLAELPAEEQTELRSLLESDADPHRIASLATTPQEGAELYLASALAIDPDHWAEQAYLNTLRDALQLDPDFARHLEAQARGED
ncbi:MAG: tellurite resistance TerB family protein [Pseudomonadota bacterium]